jgi:hypothetical protein
MGWSGVKDMSQAEDDRESLALVFLPELILLLGFGASLVPLAALIDTLSLVVGWIILSVPLAVLFGHCVLSED